MVGKALFGRENGRYLNFVADKDEITTEAIVSHFGFPPTTAKRYLRQLTEFGYLEAHGGNKNRRYSKKANPSKNLSNPSPKKVNFHKISSILQKKY